MHAAAPAMTGELVAVPEKIPECLERDRVVHDRSIARAPKRKKPRPWAETRLS